MNAQALRPNWKRLPLRRLAVCRDDLREPVNSTKRAQMQGEVPYWGANAIQDFVNQAKVNRPIVLLGEDGAPFHDRDKPVAFYIDEPIWPNNHIHVLFPKRAIDGRWLAYALNTVDYSAVITGATRDKLTQGAMMSIQLMVPPAYEQRAIADYLDDETARIDLLVSKQEGFIRLLLERRSGVIADAVTGVNVDNEFEGDDKSWIGATPEGWARGQVKHFGAVTLGKMLQSGNKGADILAPYMRAANVQPHGVLALDDVKSMWFNPRELRSLDLRTGDVVVVEGGVGGYGRAAFIEESLDGWGFQNSINRIRPFEGNDGRYLAYFLIMARQQGIITAYCNIVSMPHFTAEKLEAMPTYLPPPDAQRQIADHLDDQTARVDRLIAKAEEHISLAKERRSALITAAVTGQIDVSTARKAS